MKIVHIGNPNSLNVMNYVQDFSKMGHEIHTISSGNLIYPVNKNVIHHNFGRKRTDARKTDARPISKDESNPIKVKKKGLRWLISRAYFNFLVRRIVRRVDPDVIHGHDAAANGPMTASFKRYPRIISCWGSDIHRIPWESKDNKERIEKALQSVDIVHVTNNDFGDFIHEKLGVKEDNIRVINLPIDYDMFSPDNIDLNRLKIFRKKFNISGSDSNILYPAGFRNKNLQNYINIVKAFNKVKDHRSHPRLVMLSYGATSGLDEILEIIERNELWDRVTIINDYIQHEEMPYLLHCTDVFVIIHDVDQLARSIIESMLMGCVSILSKIKPYQTKFRDGENCLFVDQKNVDEIAKVMMNALDNLPEFRDRFYSNNYPWVKASYDTEVLNREILEMYRSLAER